MKKQDTEKHRPRPEQTQRRVKAQANYLTEDGREKPDPTPIAPPVGYIRQPTMVDRMRELVRRELSSQAADQGFETFEEADDFEIGDDYDPRSPYEEIFEPMPVTAPAAPAAAPAAPGAVGGGSGEATPTPPPAPAPTPAPTPVG